MRKDNLKLIETVPEIRRERVRRSTEADHLA